MNPTDRRPVAIAFRSAIATIAPPLAVLGLLVLLWWGIVSVFGIQWYIVPTPLQVWDSLAARGAGYAGDIWTTTQETLAGVGLGAAGGVVIAAAIAYWRPVRNAVYPVLIFSQVVPVFVVAVIVTMVLNAYALLPQIIVSALYSFLPVVVTVADGLERVDPDLIRLFRASGASKPRIFLTVRLPSALPGFFSGLKLAMVFAVSGAALGEWFGGGSGLGFYTRFQWDQFDIREVFAASVVLSVLGAALFAVVSLVEYVALPWNRRSGHITTVWKGN